MCAGLPAWFLPYAPRSWVLLTSLALTYPLKPLTHSPCWVTRCFCAGRSCNWCSVCHHHGPSSYGFPSPGRPSRCHAHLTLAHPAHRVPIWWVRLPFSVPSWAGLVLLFLAAAGVWTLPSPRHRLPGLYTVHTSRPHLASPHHTNPACLTRRRPSPGPSPALSSPNHLRTVM